MGNAHRRVTYQVKARQDQCHRDDACSISRSAGDQCECETAREPSSRTFCTFKSSGGSKGAGRQTLGGARRNWVAGYFRGSAEPVTPPLEPTSNRRSREMIITPHLLHLSEFAGSKGAGDRTRRIEGAESRTRTLVRVFAMTASNPLSDGSLP